jgi:hypothetical protein
MTDADKIIPLDYFRPPLKELIEWWQTPSVYEQADDGEGDE